jgi:hypothetical protein
MADTNGISDQQQVYPARIRHKEDRQQTHRRWPSTLHHTVYSWAQERVAYGTAQTAAPQSLGAVEHAIERGKALRRSQARRLGKHSHPRC